MYCRKHNESNVTFCISQITLEISNLPSTDITSINSQYVLSQCQTSVKEQQPCLEIERFLLNSWENLNLNKIILKYK